MIVHEGILLHLRCIGKQKNIVKSVKFKCPCGRVTVRRVSEIVGQNDTQVQFVCKGCQAVVNLFKQVQKEEKLSG